MDWICINLYELMEISILISVIMLLFSTIYIIEVIWNTLLLVCICKDIYDLGNGYCSLVYLLVFFSGLYLLYLLSVMTSFDEGYKEALRLDRLSIVSMLIFGDDDDTFGVVGTSIYVLEEISNISLLLYNSEIIINLGILIIVSMICLK